MFTRKPKPKYPSLPAIDPGTLAGRSLVDAKPDPTRDVLSEVYAERTAQDAKWGEQNHQDGTGAQGARILALIAKAACQRAAELGDTRWTLIMMEEVYEAFAEPDPARLRAELVQVAAVAVAWAEAIDRRTAAAQNEAAEGGDAQ